MTKEEAKERANELQQIVGRLYERKSNKKVYRVVKVANLIDPLKVNEYEVYISFENQYDKRELTETVGIFFTYYQELNL